MIFHSFHGCLPEERERGNIFRVDLTLTLDVDRAAASDNLEDTVNYGAVYKVVKREMSVPSNLIENVAVRIARSVKDGFPQVGSVQVCLSKRNPPVAGPVEWSRITVKI